MTATEYFWLVLFVVVFGIWDLVSIERDRRFVEELLSPPADNSPS